MPKKRKVWLKIKHHHCHLGEPWRIIATELMRDIFLWGSNQ
jgi:hypothetical protein